MNHNSGKLIIGLTGSLGSGCTTLSQALEDVHDYKRVSISKQIKEKFRELHDGKEPRLESYGPDWRAELQDIGNRGRRGEFATSGMLETEYEAYWLSLALSNGNADPEKDDIVIDGIRNIGEAEWLRQQFPNFWLLAVYADYATRWERLKKTCAYPNETVFQRDDHRDSGEGERHGQNVQKCVYEADYVFNNTSKLEPTRIIKENLAEKLARDLPGMRGEKDWRSAWPAEYFMATAVSHSHASRCIKRKVGALIVDEEDNVSLSVGYNDNPIGMEPCYSLYNGLCYKNMVMETKLEEMAPFFCPECGKKYERIEPPYLCDGTDADGQRCRCSFRLKFFPSRNIELCTAIHAEERAILSLRGRSAKGCTIYVNTFPCFQCARQIKDAGIKKVVYVEAYPIMEAVEFLKVNNIEIEPFEGFKPRRFNQVFRQVE